MVGHIEITVGVQGDAGRVVKGDGTDGPALIGIAGGEDACP